MQQLSEAQEIDQLKKLFLKVFNEPVLQVEPFQPHASPRKRFRLQGRSSTCIGVHGQNTAENLAFLSFTKTFLKCHLRVPLLYGVDATNCFYLEEDLGDLTLFNLLQEERAAGLDWSERIDYFYRSAIANLPLFQITAGAQLDERLCFQGKIYDTQLMFQDCQAFLDGFLLRLQPNYPATQLKTELLKFCEFLDGANQGHFIHRDFQSRNMLIKDQKLYFIDYQTALRGPIQYDLVALLYQAQARVPRHVRQRLIEFYIAEVQRLAPVDGERFYQELNGCIILRLLQVLATYGQEGLVNRKDYFLRGIPVALNLLLEELEKDHFPKQLQALMTAVVAVGADL